MKNRDGQPETPLVSGDCLMSLTLVEDDEWYEPVVISVDADSQMAILENPNTGPEGRKQFSVEYIEAHYIRVDNVPPEDL